MIAHSDDTTERNRRRLDHESAFESLQNPRRRWTLRYLAERGDPAAVGELADRITADEQQVDVAEIAPGARKSVYNSLTQTHLPHLEARGVVVYDRAAGTVALAPDADRLARYVPSPSADDYPWYRPVLATAGVAGAIAVANWLGLLGVSAMALNAVVVGLFPAVILAYAVPGRN